MIAVVDHVVTGDRSTVTGAFNSHSVFEIVFGCFSRKKKLLGRTETQTRERKLLLLLSFAFHDLKFCLSLSGERKCFQLI